MFSLELAQAINDWQSGGRKDKKGARLKSLSKQLPLEFRSCSGVCYRQIALAKGHLWNLADQLKLAETVSAWTTDLEVARNFKGGVPANPEYQGVIFAVLPPDGAVVLNLSRLLRDSEFQKALMLYRTEIVNYGGGTGLYGESQSEIILEISDIKLSDIVELGGFSSDKLALARKYFSHEPSQEELEVFDRLLAVTEEELGPAWVGGDAKNRVINMIMQILPSLRQIKELQDLVKDE